MKKKDNIKVYEDYPTEDKICGGIMVIMSIIYILISLLIYYIKIR